MGYIQINIRISPSSAPNPGEAHAGESEYKLDCGNVKLSALSSSSILKLHRIASPDNSTVMILAGWAQIGTNNDVMSSLLNAYLTGRLIASLKDLNGSYVLIIVKNGTGLSLVTDHFGTIPVYVFQNSRPYILISSSLAELAIDHLQGAKLDKYAALHTLRYGYSLGSRTLIKGVNVLLPGTMYTWKVGKSGIVADSQTFWRLLHAMTEARESPLGPWDEPHAWFGAFRNAWANHIDECEPVGMGLSGGLDSRLLIGMLLQDRRAPKTATFYGDPAAGDRLGALRVAQRTGVDHRELELKPDGFFKAASRVLRNNDGVLASASYIFYELGRALSSLCTKSVFMTSAEIFFGSRLKYIASLQSAAHFHSYLQSVEPNISMPFLSSYLDDRLLAQYPEIEREDLLLDQFSGVDFDPVTFHVSWDLFQRQRRFIFSNVTATLNQWLDVFEPHFATEPLNLLLSIPPRKRIGRRLERELIAKLYPHLAALPEGADGLPISNKILWRLLRSLLLRAGKRFLIHFPQFMDFGGAYHFFQDWWRDPESAPLLKGVLEKSSLVEAGILRSRDQLDALYRLTARRDEIGQQASLLLFSLYTLVRVTDSWRLSLED
jgi:asparagine synthetase B (glutamine-hydrolysing)